MKNELFEHYETSFVMRRHEKSQQKKENFENENTYRTPNKQIRKFTIQTIISLTKYSVTS